MTCRTTTGIVVVAASVWLAVAAVGCKPQPVRCVCECEGPPPEGVEVKVVQAKDEAAASSESTASTRPAASARPAASRPAPKVARTEQPASPPAPTRTPSTNRPRKATGRVGVEPGSGVPVEVSEAERQEMLKAIKEFSNAAGARNLEGMKQWTTERLGGALERAVNGKNRERLFRRTDMFTRGVLAGVELGTIRDTGDGNFDVEVKFKTGDIVHVLMFKEEGRWVLNRL